MWLNWQTTSLLRSTRFSVLTITYPKICAVAWTLLLTEQAVPVGVVFNDMIQSRAARTTARVQVSPEESFLFALHSSAFLQLEKTLSSQSEGNCFLLWEFLALYFDFTIYDSTDFSARISFRYKKIKTLNLFRNWTKIPTIKNKFFSIYPVFFPFYLPPEILTKLLPAKNVRN